MSIVNPTKPAALNPSSIKYVDSNAAIAGATYEGAALPPEVSTTPDFDNGMKLQGYRRRSSSAISSNVCSKLFIVRLQTGGDALFGVTKL